MSVLICTGDNHLGKGAHLYPGRLDEQERVWADTLRIARERGAAAVLHAGDLFDRRRPTPAELVAAARPLVEHQALGGCAVHAIPGNHDSTAYGAGGLHVLAETGLVTLWPRPALIWVADVLVAMLPWVPAGRLIAERGGRDGIVEDVVELLYRAAMDLIVESERLNAASVRIMLGHWSAEGARLPNGLPVEQLREPVLPTADLEALGFDAIVLGHIHNAGPLNGNESTFYVGSPMPLDHGDRQLAHGVWELDAAARSLVVDAHPITSPRFVTIGLGDLELAPVAGAIVRVRDTVSAEQRVDVAAIREQLTARGALRVDVELVVERASRPHAETVDTDRRPIHLLADYLGERDLAPGRVERLLERADNYLAGDRSPAAIGGT